MDKVLTKDKEHLVTENIELVNIFVRKWGVKPNSIHYDDYVSAASLGLVKAAISFEPSKKVKFSTYAYKCIQNEMLSYYRKSKKHFRVCSLDEQTNQDDIGESKSYIDQIVYDNPAYLEDWTEEDTLIQTVNIILNYLKGINRAIMLCKVAEMSNKEIARMFKITPRQVIRSSSRSRIKMRRIIGDLGESSEIFIVQKSANNYIITIKTERIKNFEKRFITFLRTIKNIKDWPPINISMNNSTIVIVTPPQIETFALLAEVIYQFD